ncbi:hypothetical protein [Sphingobacterium cellulitidis]|uniref:hypothetical protein n=1 Tax=Sphingobacterium cellulitidis TaxID=1768011 RepID=UPI000B942C95|nr:hypothetical protein CHT99_03575 [Sphingobacterium cellulitidis]
MKGLLKITLTALLLSFILISCDKDGNEVEDEKILTERIEDIIPKQYLDTLKKLDFVIHSGVKPPTVEGKFAIKPHILDTSNIASDRPGHRFQDAKIELSGQNNKDFSILLYGENFIHNRDTSITTAISGTDNKFTIYGKVKSTVGSSSAIIGMIISAELGNDGNVKNCKTGIIMIDDSKGGGNFISNGQARIAFDSDFISERIGDSKSMAKTIGNNRVPLSNRLLETSGLE